MTHLPFRLRQSLRAAALVLILVTSTLSGMAQAPQTPPAPQQPPRQWPRSHDYDVQHYRIEVNFDWTAKSVSGTTTITLRPFKTDLKEIEVDAGQMKISEVKLAAGAALKFRYEDGEHLFITLDHAYPVSSDVSIAITYTATPEKGLTFITPTPDTPTRPYQIWSQGESQDNHYWFPCYDYPNDKATTELLATVDERYQIISNGVLVSSQPDAAKKTRTWYWKMDKPYSSYLVSIIVGQFTEIKDQFKGIPIESYVYANEVDNAKLSFAKIAKMVAFFSDRIGVEFPYPKYAQTTVRDFGGGMENITATTLTDTSVHDKRAHLDVSSDGLISHELAHSWFGDLLTCRDWGQLWLNESFATFMEAMWTEHDLGSNDYLYEMMGNQQGYFQAWTQGVRRPIVTTLYTDSDAVFDAYAYPRGGAVLNMLRYTLGDDLLWKAINHYVKKNQFQNVETQQLVIAIEEATGQNLQWFFDEWLYKIGHPEFQITSTYDDGAKAVKLTVKQTQEPDKARPWFSSPEFFTMPVDIAVTTAQGEKVHHVWIDAKEKEFSFPVDSKPLIVNFDRGNYLIKQVKFDRSDDELGYQLLHDADVMGRVRAAIELKARNTDASIKALRAAATGDSFWGVRIESTKALAEMKNDATRVALLEAVNDKDSRVRRVAIDGLGRFKDPQLADLFIKIINTDQSYFAVSQAARALGQTGSPKGYDTLMAATKMPSWQDTILAGALGGLAAMKDKRAIDLAIKYTGPENQPSVRVAAIHALAEAGKGDDRVFQALAAALKDHSLIIVFNAIQALGTLGDARAIPLLEDLANNPPPGAPRGPVRQTVNEIINEIKNPEKTEEKKN